MNHIGRGDEHDLRQIVLNVEIVVHERMVLFRVQNLKQRRRWVAAKIHAHLVDFIQQKNRILRPGFLHHLDDLPREGADVSAAMTADFGFIADAAQGQPDKLAARCSRNGGGKRGFPNSRRARQSRESNLWDS